MGDETVPTPLVALLKQALTIYEKTLGPNSDEAKFVREHLERAGH